MHFRKLLKANVNHFPKRFVFKDGKKHVYHKITNRLGDEIFTTALIKYLQDKQNYFFHYCKDCYAIDSEDYFPENLVKFENKSFVYQGIDSFDPGCLWLWNEFLQERGFYCEIKDKYDKSKADLDVVYLPIVSPEYNSARALEAKCALGVFYKLLEKFPKTIMIVDLKKKKDFEFSHPNFFYSHDLKVTFDLIKRSKIFIGCDTGVSHYAGSINHPGMVLFYPDYKKMKVSEYPIYVNIKKKMLNKFKIKELADYGFSTLPCCNPQNYRVANLNNNLVDVDEVVQKTIELYV